MKRMLCLFLTGLLTLSAVACSGGNAGDTASDAATPTGAEAGQTTATEVTTEAVAATEAEPASEPVTITIRNVSSGTNWETAGTPVGDIVLEKTGINFKMEHSVGDEMEVIALMIMSDDLPDIVVPHYNVAPFVEAGVAQELTGLIETYAPTYKERLGTKWQRMIWSAEDSGRYYLTFPEQYPEQFDGKNWFLLQHAVVKELNFPKMVTLQDYENAIRQYKEKYPEIDGQPTIGMTLLADSWLWILSLTNPAMMAAGTQSSGEYYVDPDTREVTYRVLRDEETEYFRWLNHMYNEGLLDQEAFTQTEDQYKEKIAQGRVLATTNMGWYIAAPEQTLRQDGKPERTYGAYPIVLEEGIVNSTFSGPRSLEGTSFESLITTNCENQEALMHAIDYIISDEGQVLVNWGIDGVHYDTVDGQRVPRAEELEKRSTDPEYSIKTGVGLFAFLPYYRDGTKAADGQYYTTVSKQSMIDIQPDIEKEVLAGYGKEIWADFFPQPEEFPLRMWPGESSGNTRLNADSPGAVAFTRVSELVKTGVTRAIVAAPDQFDTEWARFKEEMVDGGVDVFTDAIEENNRELLTLWGVE